MHPAIAPENMLHLQRMTPRGKSEGNVAFTQSRQSREGFSHLNDGQASIKCHPYQMLPDEPFLSPLCDTVNGD